jgi:hypothetical protein
MIYESTAEIDASPAAIMSILTDGPGYATWDSGVVRVEGKIATGERVKVFAAVSPGRAFPVKVDVGETGSIMTWTGGMPLGLFQGVRTFTLTPTASGGTHFRMREQFSGPLLRLIKRSMPNLGPSFEQFAAGLKAHAEQAAREVPPA